MQCRRSIDDMSLKKRLKKWGLVKEFTVSGGTRLGCNACMKYGAWSKQEETDWKTKKTKKSNLKKKKHKKKKLLLMREVHTEEVKSPGKSSGPAEADGDDEEAAPANMIQHALQEGTFQTYRASFMGPRGRRLKYSLKRHLSTSRHKIATGARAREAEENDHAKNQDVPSDAQMMFAYDEVKKNPMVPPPCCLGDTIYTMGL